MHRNLYINGKWIDASGDGAFDVFNPSTGDVFTRVADATRADARAAIEAAESAFPAWSGMSHAVRARMLHKAGDILEARAGEIRDVLIDEGGSWIGKSMFETGYASGVFRAAAAAAYQVNGEILPSEHGKVSLVMRVPLGVVSVISPWNFPLILSSRGFATGAGGGNCVVLQAVRGDAGLGRAAVRRDSRRSRHPARACSMSSSARAKNVAEVGDELVANPAVHGVSFTGSTAVGSQVATPAPPGFQEVLCRARGKDALIVSTTPISSAP